MPSRETLLSRMVGSLMSPLSGMARFLDAAAKEVETQGKENLSQIEVKKENSEEEEKVEEVKTEASTEEAKA